MLIFRRNEFSVYLKKKTVLLNINKFNYSEYRFLRCSISCLLKNLIEFGFVFDLFSFSKVPGFQFNKCVSVLFCFCFVLTAAHLFFFVCFVKFDVKKKQKCIDGNVNLLCTRCLNLIN